MCQVGVVYLGSMAITASNNGPRLVPEKNPKTPNIPAIKNIKIDYYKYYNGTSHCEHLWIK